MLAIRLQRTGRSGHSQFRLIAQDSRFSPKRGRVVAYLGSYNPHTKEVKLDGEKISQYLSNGAQPSDTAARLIKKEGIKLPAWVSSAQPKQKTVRNPEKRRSTRPADAKPAEPEATETEGTPAETAPEAASEPVTEQPDTTEPNQEAAEPDAEKPDETDAAEPEAEKPASDEPSTEKA